MVKKKSLPPREQKLLAWRIGMKLGSAIDRHRHAHWHLKQKGDATAKRNPQPDIHVPTALANEVGMMQDFEACEELAKTIGFALAPLEGSVECRKLFYRSNKLTPEDVKWIPGFIESVDKRVEAAYDGLKGHLKAKGEVIVALLTWRCIPRFLSPRPTIRLVSRGSLRTRKSPQSVRRHF